jgi:hypothetical protein
MDFQAIAAWWGAILATLLGAFEVYKWKQENTPQLTVECKAVRLKVDDVPERTKYFCFTAVNTGNRAVTVSGAFVEMNDGERILIKPVSGFAMPFPARIEPGDALQHLVPPGPIVEARADEAGVKGVVFTDAAGNDYRGPLNDGLEG